MNDKITDNYFFTLTRAMIGLLLKLNNVHANGIIATDFGTCGNQSQLLLRKYLKKIREVF